MKVTAVFFILFAILLILSFILRGSLLAEYLKSGRDSHLVLSFYVLRGLLKYKFEIPLMKLGKSGIKVKGAKELGKDEKDIGLISRLLDYKTLLHQMKDYSPILHYIEKKFTVDRLDISIRIGTGDACYTGMLGGAVWSLLGILDSFLSNRFHVKCRKIKVKPNFGGKEFMIHFQCIFSAKLVHIIIVGFWILYNYLTGKIKRRKVKGGDKNVGTSDTGAHDHGHGKYKRYG